MKVYAVCLSAYDNGKWHDSWIDLRGKDVNDIKNEISEMLEKSPVPNSKKWAFRHYRDAPCELGENEDIAKLVALQKIIDRHGNVNTEVIMQISREHKETLEYSLQYFENNFILGSKKGDNKWIKKRF